MTWVAVAVAGGAIVGGVVAGQGAKSAASTQASAANNAAQLTQDQYNQTKASEQPFVNSGYGAQSQLNYLLGITPQNANGSPVAPYGSSTGGTATNGNISTGYDTSSGWGIGGGGTMHKYLTGGGNGVAAKGPTQNPISVGVNGHPATGSGTPNANGSAAGGYGSLLSPFTADTFHQYSPAYQFQLQQGQQGVLNGSEGSTGALSGAAMKDLMDYNQGMANTSFNNAFNQYQTQQGNIYTRLANVANLGQNAASNTGQIGANLAGSTAQSITNAGSASAAGQVGAANAYSGAINSLAGIYAANGGGGSSSSNIGYAYGGGT